MSGTTKRYVVYALEAAAAALAYGLFRILPVDAASALGGWLARTIGPRTNVSRLARANLARVMPELGAAQIAEIVAAMWDNLGRTLAEHPHLAKFDPYLPNSRVEVVGGEYIDQLKNDGKPGLFFAGHFANWELSPLAVSRRGLPLHVVYRAANNPLVDALFLRGRRVLGGGLFPKGTEGARRSVKALRADEHMAMLVDQKMNDGISVPFLGIDAMTAPALAQLALKFDCPVVPVQVERTGGAHFRITFYPPLAHPASGDRQADVAAMMADVNRHLGDWVRARPAQWLWVHNRWPPAG